MFQSIVTGFLLGGILTVMTLGLDVIAGVLGLVNVAQGEFLMFAMYAAFFLDRLFNVPIFAMFGIVPLLYLFLSIPLYLGVYRIMVGKPASSQLIYTSSLSLALQNAALVLFLSDPRQLYNPYRAEAFDIGPIQLNKALLIAFILAAVTSIIVFYFLYRTERGSVIRAAINNRQLISLLGIDPHRVYLQAFCLGIVLSAVGGVLLSIYYPVSPTVGATYNLFMWVSLVLGGIGTIRGCLAGGLITGVLLNFSAVILPVNFRNLIVLIIFMITIAVRPEGLFRK